MLISLNNMSESWATFGIDLHLNSNSNSNLNLNPATGRRSSLECALRNAVRTGRLAPGARLPSTRTLAAEIGLSCGTVSAAYDQLVAEGYLTARRGSGTEVVDLAQRPAVIAPLDSQAVMPRHDLRPGTPDVTTFPTAAWLRSVRRALNTAPADVYGYGDTRGRIELRTALAEYVGRSRGVIAKPEQIVITSGYIQALALLASTLHNAGTTVIAMEDPSLPFHREVVQRAGPTVVALPVDEHGARTDLLHPRPHTPIPPQAVIVTPAHQYPTGALHPSRRRILTDWARTTGGLVIEDDYDGEFRYDRQPVGALQGTAPDHIVYIGTASKTLGRGIRLAWIVPPAHLAEPLTEAKLYADFQTESIGQMALADLITSHAYDRHIRACRLRYRRRRDLLLDRLESRPANPAPGYSLHGIAAELHALISLPPTGPGEEELLDEVFRSSAGMG